MAYKQPYGKIPLQFKGGGKSKKFSVKLTSEGMDKLEKEGISHYTTGKSGKFLSGDSYSKVKFDVPKDVYKSDPRYKLLKKEGRYQKTANTVGLVSLAGLVGGLLANRK